MPVTINPIPTSPGRHPPRSARASKPPPVKATAAKTSRNKEGAEAILRRAGGSKQVFEPKVKPGVRGSDDTAKWNPMPRLRALEQASEEPPAAVPALAALLGDVERLNRPDPTRAPWGTPKQEDAAGDRICVAQDRLLTALVGAEPASDGEAVTRLRLAEDVLRGVFRPHGYPHSELVWRLTVTAHDDVARRLLPGLDHPASVEEVAAIKDFTPIPDAHELIGVATDWVKLHRDWHATAYFAARLLTMDVDGTDQAARGLITLKADPKEDGDDTRDGGTRLFDAICDAEKLYNGIGEVLGIAKARLLSSLARVALAGAAAEAAAARAAT